VLPAQARLRRRPEFTAVVRSGRRAGRPTMVLHYLSERPEAVVPPSLSGSAAPSPESRSATRNTPTPSPGARAGFVVGKAVGNAVIRHRVTRRLRALVGAELHRLPPTADLVVRARPEAAAADSALLGRDLSAGLDRLLADRVRSS
jgi:ribonuclease P protein component